jgi:hypothetical protein
MAIHGAHGADDAEGGGGGREWHGTSVKNSPPQWKSRENTAPSRGALIWPSAADG